MTDTTTPVAEGWRAYCADIAGQARRAPRSDSLANRLTAVRELLAMVGEELGDLHVLAYERQTLSREVAVGGGQPDYALDNHGDARARDAYRELGLATVHVVDVLAEAAHTAVRLLRAGDSDRRRTRRMINAAELAEAIEARGRRIDIGETYEPIRRQPQPELEQTVRALRSDLEQARKDLDRRPTDAELGKLEDLLDTLDELWGVPRRPNAGTPHGGDRRLLRAAIKRSRPEP